MDLKSRMIGISSVLNDSDGYLTSKQIADEYFTRVGQKSGTSDSLTTGNVLNVLALIGLVEKLPIIAGRQVRYKFKKLKKIEVV